MKKTLFIAATCLMLASCAPTQFYQMYQTKPLSEIQVKEDRMVYEDDNCTITYNFWKENGEIGFVFTNKTSENLYIHKDECFFVKNGIAYDYYQNRVYSSNRSLLSTSNLTNIYSNASSYASANYYYGSANASGSSYKNTYGASTTTTGMAGNGVSTPEKAIICIPPHTSKVISEFDIKSSIFRSCDLNLVPHRKEQNCLNFNRDNTPLTFGNRIAYSVGKSEELIRISNDFYVTKISNYEYKAIIETENEKECGEFTGRLIHVFKESGPDQFFIKYHTDGMRKH